ncbi:MAG: large conductance mechanosensitive channel protein MscL [Clostridia bacterium]|nr:large conductance mechanosensitive channel protein MscL [Clostridia bacterium]
MMKFMEEFKTFILKGNVMDMAVGVVIGGAFKGIVDSFVAYIINPLVAFVVSLGTKAISTVSGKDPSSLVMTGWVIPGTAINIGGFLSAVINFLIMAFVIFCFVKSVNKIRESAMKKEEAVVEEAPSAPTQEELLMEIRDLLKENK